jgi:hypothetical protein
MEREIIRLTEAVGDFVLADKEDQTDRRFEQLALELFEFQFNSIEPYRRLCRRKGRTPGSVRSWTEIPAVPADSFKHFFVFAGDDRSVEKTFRSSGTTAPGSNSQSHFSQTGLDLMAHAIEVNAARMLFCDGLPTRILVLAPPPELAPHMIMVHGMSLLMRSHGGSGSRFCVGKDGLLLESLLAEMVDCQEQGVPVTLMGSSFGFVHLFDAMTERGLRLTLPEGSRLMDAGGYKGRSREISRDDFISLACSMLGLGPNRVVNLLGMTEMASQIYDGVLERSMASRSAVRMKEPPAWVRTLVVDPMRPKAGEPEIVTNVDKPGLLRHLDLANVERPMMIQSEDIGFYKVNANGSGRLGFDITGRASSAEPRGCSLSIEEYAQQKGETDNEI